MKKEFRIKKSQEIESIIRNKEITGGKNFVLYTQPNHENKHYRFALSVPKKYGDAVYRNLIKRRIRSIVQEQKIKNDIDLFLVIKASASKLEFNEIKYEIIELLNKAQVLEDKWKNTYY